MDGGGRVECVGKTMRGLQFEGGSQVSAPPAGDDDFKAASLLNFGAYAMQCFARFSCNVGLQNYPL